MNLFIDRVKSREKGARGDSQRKKKKENTIENNLLEIMNIQIYRHKFTYEKRVVANSTLGADVSLLNCFYCLQSRSRGLSIAWLDKPRERLRKQWLSLH